MKQYGRGTPSAGILYIESKENISEGNTIQWYKERRNRGKAIEEMRRQ